MKSISYLKLKKIKREFPSFVSFILFLYSQNLPPDEFLQYSKKVNKAGPRLLSSKKILFAGLALSWYLGSDHKYPEGCYHYLTNTGGSLC